MLYKKIISLMAVLIAVVMFADIATAKSGPPLDILVAGYGWYRGIPEGQTNNAELVAMALDGEMIRAKDENGKVVGLGKVHSIAIPVTWDGAFPPVEEAINEINPDIILGLGTAGDMRVEPWGSNVMWGCDANPDDPDDQLCMEGQPIDESPGAPDYLEGSLPYDEIVLAMLANGIPVWRGHKLGYREVVNYEGENVSLPRATPGWYLCNYLTYKLPMYVENNDLDATVGFIHIATRPEYRAEFRLKQLLEADTMEEYDDIVERSIGYSLELERTIDAIRIALEETVKAHVKSQQ